jgi:hypothetical protein
MMIELSNDLLHVLLLLSSIFLDHLQVLLVPGLLIPQLLLVVLHGCIVTFLSTLTLFLEAALKAISLDLEEGLELGQLLLRLLLHFPQGILELLSLVLQFTLKLRVPDLGPVLALFEHPGLLTLEHPHLIKRLVLDFLTGRELFPEGLSLSDRILNLRLQGQLHLCVPLLEGIQLLCQTLPDLVVFRLQVLILL